LRRLPGGPDEVASPGVHPRVVEAERPAEPPPRRPGGGELRRIPCRRRQLATEHPARGESSNEQVRRNPRQIPEQEVHLELALLRASCPLFDHEEVAQDYVHLLAAAAEPGSAVHQPPPGAWRMNGASRGEVAEVDGAAVVEAEVPVAACVAGTQRV